MVFKIPFWNLKAGTPFKILAVCIYRTRGCYALQRFEEQKSGFEVKESAVSYGRGVRKKI
jgi:hypothetical protein